MTYNTGYGIVYPGLKDMKLEKPEVIKQGSRYGIRLNAKATSIHMIKVDVESTFEPIIGSELQSKELIDYCLLYTSDAADDGYSVDLGGRRIIKKIFFKQKTAYEISEGLVGSEMCIRDS